MTCRHARADGDEGFAMPFVLLVILMVCLGVAATFAVTTPDIAKARDDANGQRANAAAHAGIDDAEAWLEGDALCRSTTRICDKAFSADSATLVRPALTALGANVRWQTDATPTTDGNVRVRSTATVDRSTRTVVGDLALAPSILSFGYYSDFESVSPDVLVDSNPARTIRIDNGTYSSTTSSPKTLSWNGLTASAVSPCGTHWWNDGSTTGRGNMTAAQAAYKETGTGNGASVSRSASCDIVFTGGNVFDGPIYTRDALYISEDASGAGPVFNQPVVTGWGFGTHTSPAYDSTGLPWRRNTGANGSNCCKLANSPQQPTPARFDLQLPVDIGTQGVAPNACVYTGPTRVVLAGNGTATVTSPRTTTPAAGSDSRCYPGDLSSGVVSFPVDYRNGVGGGTIIARNAGTRPAAGWPETAVKNDGSAAAATGSAMWPVVRGGALKPSTSAAPDGCTSSVTYAKTANAACAWSGTPSPATAASGDGWTSASAGTCPSTLPGSLAPTDQRLFECEYTKKAGSTQTYASFRATLKAQIAAGSCLTGATTDQQTCLSTLIAGSLPADTTTSRYRVAVKAPGTPVAGAVVDGPSPATPLGSDPLFTAGPSTASRQTPTATPLTFTVTRETLVASQPKSPAVVVPQFSVTVSQTAYALTAAGTAAAYFPSLADVTPYGTADANGNVPGDLYVEGSNTGKVSLLADNDAVITGDVTDLSSDPTKDAVNIVAGSSVRNYNPVSCQASALASSITATSSGYCPDDVTGISSVVTVNSDGSVNSKSGMAQYVNVRPAADRRIDAAIFALQGSFGTDNNDRAALVGNVTVNGGVYQAHRGINGVLYSSSNGSYQVRTGYILKYKYVDLRPAKLPYEPTTRSLSGRVWRVVSISGGGAS